MSGRTSRRVRFACACGQQLEASNIDDVELCAAFRCTHCGADKSLHRESISPEHGLASCVVCEHPELYTRKSCPTWIGLLVVSIAAILAPWTHYLSLLAAALIDLVLYAVVPDVVVCYVCNAEHRGFSNIPRHPRFDREIDERLRYGARAVMGKPMRSGGTADAPEPEH